MATRAPTATAVRSGGTAAGWLLRVRVGAVLLLRQLGRIVAGLALAGVGAALAAAIITYSPRDPSFNTATALLPGNALGAPGAHVADLLLHLVGWPALMLVPALVLAGGRIAFHLPVPVLRMAAATLAGVAALSAAAGGFDLPDLGAPAGAGGLLGLALMAVAGTLEAIPELADVPAGAVLAILLAPAGLMLIAIGTAISRDSVSDAVAGVRGLWQPAEPESQTLPIPAASRRPRPAETQLPTSQEPEPGPVVVERGAAPSTGRRVRRDNQASLDLGDAAVLPGLDLLSAPPTAPRARIDAAALEQNARLLEGVLEDFGVRGRIGEVRPGPVVTMYELEPAPGIKASRVIGLADDIARSMSALSARVAVVPGRNVIGIELPNQTREIVSLSELLGSAAFDGRGMGLPLVLGKDIAGDPVVADLAPMPHLLIAGTTGSGKSVGLNAMILSLLFRMTPAQCRLIMIDPKMLELKMYDGIPHLLAPVVTEPGKAVRALKWAVEQMEDRYRKMSELNV
ncbi:MAG: DNA translocase FtsK 4TM domain-containing protein, partial [Sandarakinorhabdus sp.]